MAGEKRGEGTAAGGSRAVRRREERERAKSGGKRAARDGAVGPASWAVMGIMALVVGVVAAYVYASSGGMSGLLFTETDEGLLPVGSRAPAFESPAVDGGRVSVGGPSEGARMLVFFASWCPHCKHDAPIVRELQREYGGRIEVVMVGVDEADDPAKARSFVRGHGILGKTVFEPSLAEGYRASSYPTVYVLDRRGEIVAANVGEAPEGAYRGWIEEALSS